jgi:hypothetical protein
MYDETEMKYVHCRLKARLWEKIRKIIESDETLTSQECDNLKDCTEALKNIKHIEEAK